MPTELLDLLFLCDNDIVKRGPQCTWFTIRLNSVLSFFWYKLLNWFNCNRSVLSPHVHIFSLYSAHSRKWTYCKYLPFLSPTAISSWLPNFIQLFTTAQGGGPACTADWNTVLYDLQLHVLWYRREHALHQHFETSNQIHSFCKFYLCTIWFRRTAFWNELLLFVFIAVKRLHVPLPWIMYLLNVRFD